MRHVVRAAGSLLLALPALAQPPAGVELFGHGGYFNAGGDEGRLGSSAGYGASAMLGFSGRVAVDIGVMTTEVTRQAGTDLARTRRTLVLPSLVGRWGSERGYFFAGGGVSAQMDRFTFQSAFSPGLLPPGARDLGGGRFETVARETGPMFHARTGVVRALGESFLVRIDLIWAHRYVLPNIVATGGIGIRF